MKNLLLIMLRRVPGNGWIYPIVFRLWKYFVTPIRRRKLQKCGSDVLGRMHDVLVMHNIEYSVYWGTLLGIVRENAFIKHDDDIDLLINPTNFSLKDILPDMRRFGFSFIHAVQTKEKVLYYTFARNGLRIDLFCKLSVGDDDYDFVPVAYKVPGVKYDGFETGWKICKYVACGSSQLREFKGIMINVPSSSEKVLESIYGVEWRIPDSKFKGGDIGFNVMQDHAYRVTDVSDVLR